MTLCSPMFYVPACNNAAITCTCPYRSLTLINCAKLTDGVSLAIGSTCTNLSHLILVDIFNLYDDAVRLLHSSVARHAMTLAVLCLLATLLLLCWLAYRHPVRTHHGTRKVSHATLAKHNTVPQSARTR